MRDLEGVESRRRRRRRRSRIVYQMQLCNRCVTVAEDGGETRRARGVWTSDECADESAEF